VYDPTPLLAWTAWRSDRTAPGTGGGRIVAGDVHHRAHPRTKNEDGVHGVSLGFTSHYALMRNRLRGAHHARCAGENIIVEPSVGSRSRTWKRASCAGTRRSGAHAARVPRSRERADRSAVGRWGSRREPGAEGDLQFWRAERAVYYSRIGSGIVSAGTGWRGLIGKRETEKLETGNVGSIAPHVPVSFPVSRVASSSHPTPAPRFLAPTQTSSFTSDSNLAGGGRRTHGVREGEQAPHSLYSRRLARTTLHARGMIADLEEAPIHGYVCAGSPSSTTMWLDEMRTTGNPGTATQQMKPTPGARRAAGAALASLVVNGMLTH